MAPYCQQLWCRHVNWLLLFFNEKEKALSARGCLVREPRAKENAHLHILSRIEKQKGNLFDRPLRTAAVRTMSVAAWVSTAFSVAACFGMIHTINDEQ